MTGKLMVQDVATGWVYVVKSFRKALCSVLVALHQLFMVMVSSAFHMRGRRGTWSRTTLS